MVNEELQEKERRVAELRQAIRDEKASRSAITREATDKVRSEQLDREAERLERDLEAERAVTAAQEKASAGESVEGPAPVAPPPPGFGGQFTRPGESQNQPSPDRGEGDANKNEEN